jgi:cation transport regulator
MIRPDRSIMPYDDISKLPVPVRNNLPVHGQEIYLAPFNNAWEEYKGKEKRRSDTDREETVHRVAWAAGKSTYAKDEKNGKWRKK